MLGQIVFFASGPAEISGNILSTNTGNLGSSQNRYSNLYLTGTGFADEFSARKTSASTGEITSLSIYNLYPIGQPDLGHNSLRWRHLYITGTGYMDKLSAREISAQTGSIDSLSVGTGYFDKVSVREISAQTGEITGLSVGNIYPVNQPNLGHSSQKWNNCYLTGTGYSYSQEVIYNGQSEEVITRAETTGRFVCKTVLEDQTIDFSSGAISGLFFNMTANKTYKFDYSLHYSGSATSEGIHLCFSGTSSSTFAAGNILINDFNSTVKAYPVTGYLQVISNNQGSTDRNTIFANILVTNGPQDSTLHLIASKETNSSSPALSINSGSWATMTQY